MKIWIGGWTQRVTYTGNLDAWGAQLKDPSSSGHCSHAIVLVSPFCVIKWGCQQQNHTDNYLVEKISLMRDWHSSPVSDLGGTRWYKLWTSTTALWGLFSTLFPAKGLLDTEIQLRRRLNAAFTWNWDWNSIILTWVAIDRRRPSQGSKNWSRGNSRRSGVRIASSDSNFTVYWVFVVSVESLIYSQHIPGRFYL